MVAILGIAALAAMRGPSWYQRLYHPLMYKKDIAYAARKQHVNPYLVAAVINVESAFDADDVSPAGAVGLMQVMPATALEVSRRPDGSGYSAEELCDPKVNVWIGTKYLAKLIKRYDGNVGAALAAYNAGSRHADRWSRQATGAGSDVTQTVSFPETKRYMSDVMREIAVYRRLYPGAFTTRSSK